MSTDWKPKPSPDTNLLSLTLNNLEGFTVSRLDGDTSVHEFALLTGQTDALRLPAPRW